MIQTAGALKRDIQHKRTALIKVQEADFHWFTKISIGRQVFSVLIDTGSSALWAYTLDGERDMETNMLADGFLDRMSLVIRDYQLMILRKAPPGVLSLTSRSARYFQTITLSAQCSETL